MGSTGDATRDAAILEHALSGFELRAGDRLSPVQLETIRARIEDIEGVERAEVTLEAVPGQTTRTRVRVVVFLTSESVAEAGPSRALPGEGAEGFPTSWREERGYARFILAGGLGVFTDGDPWFGNAPTFTVGNPLVENPAVGADTGGPVGVVRAAVFPRHRRDRPTGERHRGRRGRRCRAMDDPPGTAVLDFLTTKHAQGRLRVGSCQPESESRCRRAGACVRTSMRSEHVL